VKVADYRESIDALGEAFASLRSAATAEERLAEALRVSHLADCLGRADCPRAKPGDTLRADRLRLRVREYLEGSGLALEVTRRREADALLARLAFGAEWR
jgi:hypothetical protein